MGVTKSNNEKGNQFHDDTTGEFTSKDGAGASSSAPKEEEQAVAPKIKLKAGTDLQSFFEKAKDMNTCAEVPLLRSVEDIDANIDKLFSKKVCSNIDSLYGKTTNVSSYNFAPDPSRPRIALNIFVCVLGKNRYKDNHARYIDQNEFRLLSNQNGYKKVYRGFSSEGDKRKKILDGYVSPDVNFFSVYGVQGAYGTNLYTTVNKNYALGYADYHEEKIMQALLDTRNSKYIDTDDLDHIQYRLKSNTELLKSIKGKVKQQFEKSGVDSTRSDRIANSFIKTLTSYDESILGILLGYDYQISESHQRNILNLGKMLILNKDL